MEFLTGPVERPIATTTKAAGRVESKLLLTVHLRRAGPPLTDPHRGQACQMGTQYVGSEEVDE